MVSNSEENSENIISESYFYSIKLSNEDIAKKVASSTNKQYVQKLDNFAVGDYVRATYTDGSDYEAQILTIEDDMCTIRYIGYDNEEKTSLDSLLPSWGKSARRNQFNAAKESESQTKRSERKKSEKLPKTFTNWIPPPPAIPINSLALSGDSGDSEQLYAMLMSWYMTGYYTGLHQGSMNNKKKPQK